MADRKGFVRCLSSTAPIALTPFIIAATANAQGYTASTAKGDYLAYALPQSQ